MRAGVVAMAVVMTVAVAVTVTVVAMAVEMTVAVAVVVAMAALRRGAPSHVQGWFCFICPRGRPADISPFRSPMRSYVYMQ